MSHLMRGCRLRGCSCGKYLIVFTAAGSACGHCGDLMFGEVTGEMSIECKDGVAHWTHLPTSAVVHRCGRRESAEMWAEMGLSSEAVPA